MPYPIVWDWLWNLCTRNKYLHTYTHTYRAITRANQEKGGLGRG